MPNYAYNRPTSFSGVSGTPFLDWANGLNPAARQSYENLYMTSPGYGVQRFIDLIRPSNQNEELLRRMIPQIKDQWMNQWMENPSITGSFTDFLGKYDFDRAFARINPQVRNERGGAFNRPGIRTLTF